MWLELKRDILHRLSVDPALTHLTKLDDNLLPRGEALRDFTAADSSHLSFRVYMCVFSPDCFPTQYSLISDREGLRNFPPIRPSFEL